jgi:hypothetical protein
MNKFILAIALAATAAAIVPANAGPRAASSVATETAKMVATSPGGTLRVGNQCWKPTDAARGYGFWTSCDHVYAYVIGRNIRSVPPEVLLEIDRGGGTEGGGGDGGGSGGGAR